jgi:hypothetical protein
VLEGVFDEMGLSSKSSILAHGSSWAKDNTLMERKNKIAFKRFSIGIPLSLSKNTIIHHRVFF